MVNNETHLGRVKQGVWQHLAAGRGALLTHATPVQLHAVQYLQGKALVKDAICGAVYGHSRAEWSFR